MFADTEETKFSVRDRDSWRFLLRTSRTSLKLIPRSSIPTFSKPTTFALCCPTWSALELGCCARDSVCRDWSWAFRAAQSCLITKVNWLISTGLSSKSVFRFATVIKISR